MRRVITLTAALVLLLACTAPAIASTPYRTFTYTPDWGFTGTQTAYEPVMTITKIDELSMLAPSDIRFGPDGNLYIADTGNRRILVCTTKGELVAVYGEGLLQKPKGVFVDETGRIYVADEQLEAVLLLSPQGELIREYTRPVHPLFGQYSQFKPQKVTVDKRGNLYVISKGNTNGIIQIANNADQSFLGYFGANQTKVSLLTALKQIFYTDEQKAKTADILPITVTNMTINDQGLVYTVSQGDAEAPLKKLNVAGKNIITVDYAEEQSVAVAVSPSGSIFTADISGYIVEYTSEGDLLFYFGAHDDNQQRVGLFTSVAGMVVDGDNRLYVLDEVKNCIQVFAPTEFADMVHEAFDLFQAGKYLESREPWTEIVKMNSLFSYANTGLGEVNYRERDYAAALAAFRTGNNFQGYSDSFWELRSDWLKNNLGLYIILVAGLFVLWQLVKLADRRLAFLTPVRGAVRQVTGRRLFIQCTHTLRNIKNPADAAYGIKRENKSSWTSSLILLAIIYLLFVLEKYFAGFLFKAAPDGYYDFFGDAVMLGAVLMLATVSCYLVCTITEGEASYKELFAGFIYAFAPYFILKPIIIIATNVLTLNEGFFLTLGNVVVYAWTGILIFLAIKNLNDYTFGKAIRTVLLTIFVAFICVLLLFIIYVLISQVLDFGSSIIGEAVFKLVKN